MMNNYCIRKDYKIRPEIKHCDKTTKTASEFQKEVYQLALKLAKKNGFKKILDLGCGSGYKLMNYFKNFEKIGVEIEPTLSWLKKKYPNNRWVLSDFNKPYQDPVDMIICADVIEHVSDPDMLLDWIYRSNPKIIIISTPDRNVLVKKYKREELGPPFNQCHIREWNYQEFEKYIGEKFHIIDHELMKKEYFCQVVVCKNK